MLSISEYLLEKVEIQRIILWLYMFSAFVNVVNLLVKILRWLGLEPPRGGGPS